MIIQGWPQYHTQKFEILQHNDLFELLEIKNWHLIFVKPPTTKNIKMVTSSYKVTQIDGCMSLTLAYRYIFTN